MLTCMIVDDEESAINVLRSYVEKVPFLQLVGTALDPLQALEQLRNNKADLVFLDIHMPNLSGLDMMRMIPHTCKVVLTTAYSEFAVKGFELEALDYLLKPISFERFLRAAQRALAASQQQPAAETSHPEKTAQPEKAGYPEMENDFLFVKTETKGKMIKVKFSEIMYIEGLKNYVSIFTPEERIVTYTSFIQLEEMLPPSFMRVHKSYIVPLDKIKAVDGNQILLYNMKNYIPMGESYRSAFFNALKQRIIGGKK
jgi:DNA-binding LytR/AlgR family response regulator